MHVDELVYNDDIVAMGDEEDDDDMDDNTDDGAPDVDSMDDTEE